MAGLSNTDVSDLICIQVIPYEGIYFVYTWYGLVTLLSGCLLFYTFLAARKKKIEVEEYTQPQDFSDEEDYEEFAEGREDLDDFYSVVPEEYRPKRISRDRVTSLDQIAEDDEDDEENYEDGEEEKDNDSDEDTEEEPPHIKTRARDSLAAGAGDSTYSKTSRESSYSQVSSSRGSDPSTSRGSILSSSSEGGRGRTSLRGSDPSSSDGGRTRSSLNVPGAQGGRKTGLVRSESQNRADFLLRVLSRPGEINEYVPTPVVVQKRSPTGRKISTDVAPSNYQTLPPRLSLARRGEGVRRISAMGEAEQRPTNHLYVNLPPRSASSSGLSSSVVEQDEHVAVEMPSPQLEHMSQSESVF